MKNLTEQNIAELRQAQEILNRVLPKLTDNPKPIPHGTMCLVGDNAKDFVQRYSDGKGSFYFEGKSGAVSTWKHAIPFTPEMQQIVEEYIKNNQ